MSRTGSLFVVSHSRSSDKRKKKEKKGDEGCNYIQEETSQKK